MGGPVFIPVSSLSVAKDLRVNIKFMISLRANVYDSLLVPVICADGGAKV